MKKTTVYLSLLAMTAASLLSTQSVEATATYEVDTLVDITNPGDNWLTSAPTLQAGSTYDVSFTGTGYADDISEIVSILPPELESILLPAELAIFQLYLDSSSISSLVFSEEALGFGDDPNIQSYAGTASFLLPAEVPEGLHEGFFALTPFGGLIDPFEPVPSALPIDDDPFADDLFLPGSAFNYHVTNGSFEHPSAAVPEPATMTLLGLGLAGTGILRRKRNV